MRRRSRPSCRPTASPAPGKPSPASSVRSRIVKPPAAEPQVNPPPTPSQHHVLARRGCVRRARPRRARAESTPPTYCRAGRPSTIIFVERQAELLRGRVHDADIGLVRNQPVDRVRPSCRSRPALPRATSASTLTANLNTALPSIWRNGMPLTAPFATVPGNAEDVAIAAVGVQMRRQDARRRRRQSARPRRRRRRTARRCRGRSSRGCANRSRRRRPARCARCRSSPCRSASAERVDEAAADRLHVERRAAASRQAWPAGCSGRRKDHVGRRRRDDDQIDVRGRDARRGERRPRRCQREIARQLARRRDVALADAGARTIHSSLVSMRLREFGRWSATCGGQVAAGAGDAAIHRVGAGAAVAAADSIDGIGIDAMRCAMRSRTPCAASA